MIDTDTPEICAARAADPAWRAEMQRRREAAEARFAERREEIGQPLIQKKSDERF